MILKINSCLTILLFGIQVTYSQELAHREASYPHFNSTSSNVIKPLTIGDKVPGQLLIENIINFKASSCRMSDFAGKVILIDFWGTTCSNCIKALPNIDSLQKIFGDKLQVFTVTNYDTKEKVVNTLNRFHKTRNLSIPVVLNDVKLKKYFPHEIISHVVWVDTAGVVRGITGTDYITAKNIQAVYNGTKVDWPVKDDAVGFDYQNPLLSFSQSNIVQPDFIYYSSFSGHMDGIDGGNNTFVDSSKNTITRNNFNLLLLQYCAGSLTGGASGYTNPKLLILQVKDKSRYIRDARTQYASDWHRNNSFCYSLTLPLGMTVDATRRAIRADLTRWLDILGITVKKETRNYPCLVLVRTEKKDDLLKSKGGARENTLNENLETRRLTNNPFNELLWHLNEETPGIPWVVDETGISPGMLIDIELKIDSMQNITALRKQLQRYGLDLRPAEREMEIVIVTESN